MYCNTCGFPMQEGETVCRNCGAAVNPAIDPNQLNYAQAPYDAQGYGQQPYKATPASSPGTSPPAPPASSPGTSPPAPPASSPGTRTPPASPVPPELPANSPGTRTLPASPVPPANSPGTRTPPAPPVSLGIKTQVNPGTRPLARPRKRKARKAFSSV